MIQTTISKKEDNPSSFQETSHYSQSGSIKKTKNNHLELQQDNLNSQSMRRINTKTLTFSIKWPIKNDKTFQTLAKTLQAQRKALRELQISTGFQTNISNRGIFYISQALKSLGSLQTIDLTIRNWAKISEKGLEHLGQGLKRALRLKTVVLFFQEYHDIITDIGVQKICEGLSQITSLEDLTWEFVNAGRVSSKSVESIGECVKKLRLLSKLSLKFRNCRRAAGLNYLTKSLKNLKYLKNLEVAFLSSHNNYLKVEFLEFGEILKSLVSLQTLSFNIAFCEVFSDDILENLSQCFGEMTGLRNLSLNFQSCNITDAGLEFLSDGLKNLLNLQSIHLVLSWHHEELTDEGIKSLSKALKNLQNLKNLNFECENCPLITNTGINFLSQSLLRIKSLQKLCLNFGVDEKITNKGVWGICRLLKNLPLLLSLKLSFRSCSKFTNSGLEELSQSLKKLTLLQKIYLDFSECKQIRDIFLENLTESLMDMNYLRDLRLGFSSCSQVTDAGLVKLAQGLRECPVMDKVWFDVAWCKKITKLALENIRQGFKSINCIIVDGN